MAIEDNTIIKVAQEINLPESVIAMNIYYFVTEFTSEQADEDVIDAAKTWVQALYNVIASEYTVDVTLGDMVVYTYNLILDQWDNIGSGAPVKDGTEVTAMLPHGVAALVRAYSTNARSIARKYLAGFGEDQQQDGVWVAGTLTALASYADAWVTPEEISVGNDLLPGVFDTGIKTLHQFTQTTVVLATPAYQRRRRPGVGI